MALALRVKHTTEAPKPDEKPYGRFGPVILDFFRYRGKESVLEGPADTGKSRACLEFVHAAMQKYAGARAAFIRKTRKSLTTTAMVTYERWVRPDGASHLWGDQEYRYPNDSKIYLLGMDDPEKVKSLEADLIYVQEASELTIEDWEILTTRVTGRGAVMPYTRLIADMNPVDPGFHLYQRESDGKVRFFQVRHSDNPTVTPDRLAPLEALTGYRRDRLFLGLRVAAEGMYFDEWEPRRHVCEPFAVPAHWVRWVSVDYGFADPFCALWFARDPATKRVYLYREVYGKGLYDHQQAKLILERSEWERISRFVLDPSMFNKRTEQGKPSIAAEYARVFHPKYASDLVVPGMNDRKQGWPVVRRALAWQEKLPDGDVLAYPPRLQVMHGRCPNLVRTLPAMVRDNLDPEDLADVVNGQKTEDHPVDTLRYGLVLEATRAEQGPMKVKVGGR